MSRRVRYVAVALLGLIATSSFRRATADYDETERRLKAVGLDDGLRKQIHDAIDRGVDFLVKRQRADGAFVDHWQPPHDSSMGRELGGGAVVSNVPGVSLLCTLALRHAGTPPTEAPVERALKWLFIDELDRTRAIEREVYESGLALMLLAGVPGHELQARRFAAALAGALDDTTASWGYDTPGGGGDAMYPRPGFHASVPNLSTAQFGALGLWAARRMGIDVAPSVWARHAASLCDRQRTTGSWDYSDDSVRVERGGGRPSADIPETVFPTKTYMGIANLLLCKQALATARGIDPKLVARVELAIGRARATLARDAPWTLADPRSSDFRF